VFTLPPGTSIATLALAATSGFLAFAGFESAGSLGEEALLPRRQIPRAIWTSVAFGAVFYVACMTTQSLGFGTSAAGVRAFAGSPAPLGDLAAHFVGSPLATLLDAGAVLSALGAALGGVTVAARMMLALTRDGLGPPALARISPAARIPARALAVEMTIALVLLTAFRLTGTAPLDVFFYLATLGVLNLLVMYVLTNVGAVRTGWGSSLRDAVLPVLGAGIAAYVLYRNVWPVPPSPYRWFPYGVLAWLAGAVVIGAVVPDFAKRVGSAPGGASDQAE
jgi:amino acid transporter